jgi:putative thioredoxin
VREVIEQVLVAAASAGANGVTNDGAVSDQDAPVVSDPRFDAAEAALESGDWQAAIAAYQEVLRTSPNDAIAKIGLLNVELLQRTDGIDFEETLALTGTDAQTQMRIADVEFICNEFADAFTRLVEVIRDQPDERQVVRERLLQLFDIAGPTDPAVVKARTALSNALF